ncbi:hypothetical protein Tco_0947150, partial [Tanacetum coccineum]
MFGREQSKGLGQRMTKGNTIVHPLVSLDEHVAYKGRIRFLCDEEKVYTRDMTDLQKILSQMIKCRLRPDNDDINLKFETKAGRKDELITNQPTARFDRRKVRFYKCLQLGHFARECNVKTVDDKARYSAFKVTEVKTDEPKALVSVDSMVNWSDHAAENKTGEVEKVYGMMARLHADNGGADVSKAAAEFGMYGGLIPRLEEMHAVLPPFTGNLYAPLYIKSDIEETQLTSSDSEIYASCDQPQDQDQRLPQIDGSDPAASRNRPAVNSAGRPKPTERVGHLRDDGGICWLRPQQVPLGGIKTTFFWGPRVMVVSSIHMGDPSTDNDIGQREGRHVKFGDTACLVLTEEFQLPDESQWQKASLDKSPDGIEVGSCVLQNNQQVSKEGLKMPTMVLDCGLLARACYVLNRVSITIPLIKHLMNYIWEDRFSQIADEGYLVGYAPNSKVYRVYNLTNKRVEETLNLRFLEDKPNDQGIGHEWYFDLDYLTDSFGYTCFKTDKPAGTQETNINAGTQDDDSDSEVDEQVIVVPSFPSNSFAGPSTSNGPSVMERNADYAEELAKLQRQEYEAKDAAARYGYLFSQETTEIISQAKAEIRNHGVSANRDPAGIDSAGGLSDGSDPAGGNPAGSFQPTSSFKPA